MTSLKASMRLARRLGKHVGPAMEEAWKGANNLGHEAAKMVGPAVGEAIKNLDAFGQEAGRRIGPAVHGTAAWIGEHPGETAGIAACVVAAPVAIAITGPVLGVMGFTSSGVAAAAAYQATVGNVAAGSAFAVLQSAGAGGIGAVVVNGIVGSAATVGAVAATVPGLTRAFIDSEKQEEELSEVDSDAKED